MLHHGNRLGVVMTLSLLLLSVAFPAGARGPARGGFGPPGFRGPGPVDGFTGRVLEQLISPCRANCFDTTRACHDMAETAALGCAQEPCATEIATAQSACATAPPSQACRVAVRALRSCSEACLDTFRDAVASCRDALEGCLDSCESAQ